MKQKESRAPNRKKIICQEGARTGAREREDGGVKEADGRRKDIGSSNKNGQEQHALDREERLLAGDLLLLLLLLLLGSERVVAVGRCTCRLPGNETPRLLAIPKVAPVSERIDAVLAIGQQVRELRMLVVWTCLDTGHRVLPLGRGGS